MFETIINDISNTFKALIALLLKPTSCFEKSKDGYLICSGIGGIRFWLYILLFEALLFLITSRILSDNFSKWFIIITLITSITRMIILVGIWSFFSKLFFDEVRPIISICFFTVAAVSLFMYLPTIPAIYDVGLSNFLSGNLPNDFMEKYKYNFLAMFIIGVISNIYAIIFIADNYNKNFSKATGFIIIVVIVYTVIRPIVVVPMMELAVDFVLSAPWDK